MLEKPGAVLCTMQPPQRLQSVLGRSGIRISPAPISSRRDLRAEHFELRGGEIFPRNRHRTGQVKLLRLNLADIIKEREMLLRSGWL